MRINHNLSAMNTYSQLTRNEAAQSKSMQQLSSGKRINSAADDAAGFSISEKMRNQLRGLEQASRNSQEGMSLLQTADGGLNEIQDQLTRMRELVVQAKNGTNNTEETDAIQKEINTLIDGIHSIATDTQFNGQSLLSGTLGAKTATVGADLTNGTGKFKIADVTGAAIGNGYKVDTKTAGEITVTNSTGTLSQTIKVSNLATVNVGDQYNFDKLGIKLEAQKNDISGVDSAAAGGKFDVTGSGISLQTGANSGQKLDISISSVDSSDLGTAGGLNIQSINVKDFTTNNFATQLQAVDDAIKFVSTQRSQIGAWQNSLQHTVNNLDAQNENLTAASSRITDVDMAKAVMENSKNGILAQAAQAMLAQANQQPQSVLQLLR
ncbi:flagellin [Neobacillus sp. 19]|uniref:flagellin N-terminal helical domain-containing protein n=1 Tax=Neobacillus sp. 19 TaxID=3394458 RepID=UPI003BF6B1DF